MKKITTKPGRCLLAALMPLTVFAQSPSIQWNKLLGGDHNENAVSIRQTNDGGYILLSSSNSSQSGDVSGALHANPFIGSDYWIVKMDAVGNNQWDKLMGGSTEQSPASISQTADGGYIVSGSSSSSQSGDVSGVNHNIQGGNPFADDYWIVKLDPSGNKQWDKLLGGHGSDVNRSIQQTSDGGYIVAGFSGGSPGQNGDGDITGVYKGVINLWIVKLDATGNKIWDKLMGGNGMDINPYIRQTTDGGYIVAANSTSSQSGDVSGVNHGSNDCWVFKLDASGQKVWDKLLGGAGSDGVSSIQQTSDGGYIFAGTSESSQSGDVSGINHGASDCWVVKLDVAGNKIWDQLLGGPGSESVSYLQQARDGGYILAGTSNSILAGDVNNVNHGNNDCWILKLDRAGNKIWNRLIGGTDNDNANCIQQTTDGGYVFVGFSNSSQSGDVTGINHGQSDAWVVKLAPDPTPVQTPGTGLQGIYYNGITLSGTPILNRVDTTINFELTYEKIPQILSPAPGIVPDDKYSVRWTGQVQAQYSETYTFYTVNDDGIRLWINGVQLVDDWMNQSATEKSGTIALVAGQKYNITIEYYENTGDAVTKLLWSGPSTPKAIIPKSQLYPPAIITGTGTGLQGFYYNGINLSGAPLLGRVDSTINFDLAYGKQPQVLSPAPGIVPEDMYSVRWTGQVLPQYSEVYTFYTVSDDGIRLWVNGIKLIDNWTNQSATEKNATIPLAAGQKYDILIEYYENTGNAVTKLLWSSPSTPKAIVPKSQLYPITRGLLGVYYNGTALSGPPLLSRIDTTINFELTYGKLPQVLSPAPGIVPEDKYSVRWTGQVQAQYSEVYSIYAVSDDGIRLWINGTRLVDNWVNQSATEKMGTLELIAGQKYDIIIEYYENTGDAVTKLYWSSRSTPKTIIPQTQLFPPVMTSGARVIGAPTVTTTFSAPVALPQMTSAISPNPVSPGMAAKLVIYSNNNMPVMLTVNGIHGQTIRTQRLNLAPGINTINVNTNGLARGLYIINVTGGRQLLNSKLVIQ